MCFFLLKMTHWTPQTSENNTLLLCISCAKLFDHPDILSIILRKEHLECALVYIEYYQIVGYSDLELIITLDNVEFFKNVCELVPKHLMPIYSAWEFAIKNESYNLMEYLEIDYSLWISDVEYAASIGKLCSLKYLVEELGRRPSPRSVRNAGWNGHMEVLRYLRLITSDNPTFKTLIWDSLVVVAAITNGHLECMKYIVEDDSLWDASTMDRVVNNLGPLMNVNPQLQERIVDCVRYARDSSFMWIHFLCPILFDGCMMIDCSSCFATENSYNDYGQILNSYFNGDLTKLMVSFAVTYERCHYCKKVEIYGEPQFDRCSRCRTTYYCGKICQKKSWKLNHKNTCGKWS